MIINQLNNTPNKRDKRGLNPEYRAVIEHRLQEIQVSNDNVKLAGVRIFPNLFSTVKILANKAVAPAAEVTPEAISNVIDMTTRQPITTDEQQTRLANARRDTANAFNPTDRHETAA